MHKSTPVAIEQESAGLRTLRRLSNNASSMPLDPDLPIPRVPNGHSYGDDAGAQGGDESFEEDASNDSSHMFWLPAHLHPELAPAEFRAFLQEHTSSSPSNDPQEPLGRSLSRGKSLGRQKSMLSRQYRPSANDGVESESSDVVPTRRNLHRPIASSQSTPSLSANELQQLEFLADEAVKSGDPTRLRSVLKRSISMNQHSVIDQMDNIGGDEADAPIVTPQPNQSLKRSVRTKIRKASLQGTGGGHRFPATRKGKVFAAAPDRYIPPYDVENESPASSENDHSQSSGYPTSQHPSSPPHASFANDDNDGREGGRPLSYSDIYDSYADRTSLDQDDIALDYSYPSAQPQNIVPVVYEPPPQQSRPPVHEFDNRVPHPVAVTSPPPQPSLQHPSPRPHQLPVPSSQSDAQPNRSPSPGSVSDPHTDGSSMAPSTNASLNGKRKDKERDKEKKSLFGKSKWGSEKEGKIKKDKSKSSSKHSEKSERESAKEKEKDSGFFGSLFGGKKKSDESAPIGSGAGPATAAALLGQSRSKSSPAITPDMTGMGYARYPIHVERAVYRLSHIKLANPRRPLQEQVLISNLMFWYLGVINKPTAPPQPAAAPVAQQPATAAPQDEEREQVEKERIEHEQRVAAERERDQQEQARREQQVQQPQASPRKGGLNKAAPLGADARGGARKAEMPVKGPQYGIGMVMEHGNEYDQQQQQHWQTRQERSPPPVEQPYSLYVDTTAQEQPSPRNANSARSPPPISRQPPRSPPSSLPPGAMPPVNNDHSWLVQNQLNQGGPPPSNRGSRERITEQEQPFYQSEPPQRSRSVPPTGWPDQPHEDVVRQQRSPPPSVQQAPPSLRTRSPSYNAGGPPQSTGSGGRPKTSPIDTTAANSSASKLQGRSLSASAVPSNSGGDGGRSRSPPPQAQGQQTSSGGSKRSRSRPREEIPSQPSPPPQMPPNGVRVVRQDDWQRKMGASRTEEEDLPLAVYQRQQQQERQQQPQQYYPQSSQQQYHSAQEYDWNHPRR